MILREATIKYSGVDPNNLKPYSRKRICKSCDKCGRVNWVKFNHLSNLCPSCAQLKNNKLIIKICEQCNHEYKIIPSIEKTSKFCSQKCKNKYHSIKQNSSNNSNWRGGLKEGRKRYYTKKKDFQYIPLNDPFPGCEGHHITKDFVIHIPKELHKHIRHNMFSGQNMLEINVLAYQFMNGEL